ncbi:pupal cuticle protein-like [Pectinophora gossypiella]|nr:pupal cuticle protein-like [Pectinophora gossypiella]
MKFMIVAACLALACGAHANGGWTGPPANIALSQDGRNILDTPEVAQARAAHISALQRASQNNPNPNDDGSYNPAWDNEEYWQRADQNKWNAPAPQWNAAPAQSWNAAPAQSWNAPAPAWNAAGPAPPPVAETPEVAQARAAHLAALSAAKSAAPAQQQWNAPASQQWNAPAPQQWNAPQQQWNAPAPQWNGAPSWQSNGAHQAANIQLARDGSGILDTPEVAAARAAHLAAHQQVAHNAPPAHPQQHW